MAALGKEVVFLASRRYGLPDEILAVYVAFCRVDDIEPGVESGVENLVDRGHRHALVADLGSAEAEGAHLHVRLAESPLFHI